MEAARARVGRTPSARVVRVPDEVGDGSVLCPFGPTDAASPAVSRHWISVRVARCWGTAKGWLAFTVAMRTI
jgi:hypothetical protein